MREQGGEVGGGERERGSQAPMNANLSKYHIPNVQDGRQDNEHTVKRSKEIRIIQNWSKTGSILEQ